MEGVSRSNEATRQSAAACEALNRTDDPIELDRIVSPGPDFIYEDRRSGFNFGIIDAAGFTEFIASTWTVGSGRPYYSVPKIIATRGERLAVVEFSIAYGDGSTFESAQLIELEPGLRGWRRCIDFDPSDVETALALLDELDDPDH